jgi:hypothetical protein
LSVEVGTLVRVTDCGFIRSPSTILQVETGWNTDSLEIRYSFVKGRDTSNIYHDDARYTDPRRAICGEQGRPGDNLNRKDVSQERRDWVIQEMNERDRTPKGDNMRSRCEAVVSGIR